MVEGGGKVDSTSVVNQAPILMMAVLIGDSGIQQQVTEKEIEGRDDGIARRLPIRRESNFRAGHQSVNTAQGMVFNPPDFMSRVTGMKFGQQFVAQDQAATLRHEEGRQHPFAPPPDCQIIMGVG